MNERQENKQQQELHERLCAVILGEATDVERAEIEIALAASAELRAEKQRLEATIGLVQDTLGAPPEVQLPEAARAELTAAATAPSGAGAAGGPGASMPETVLQPVPRARAWYQSVPLGFAGAAAAVLLAWFGLERWGGPQQPAPEDTLAKGEDGSRAAGSVAFSTETGTGFRGLGGPNDLRKDDSKRGSGELAAGRAGGPADAPAESLYDSYARGLAPSSSAEPEGNPATETLGREAFRKKDAPDGSALHSIGYAEQDAGEVQLGLSGEDRQLLATLGYGEPSFDLETAEVAFENKPSAGLDPAVGARFLRTPSAESKAAAGDPLLVRADQVTDFEHIQRAAEEADKAGQGRVWKVTLGESVGPMGPPAGASGPSTPGPGGPPAPAAPASGAYRGTGDSVPPGGGGGPQAGGSIVTYAPHANPPQLVFPPSALDPYIGDSETAAGLALERIAGGAAAAGGIDDSLEDLLAVADGRRQVAPGQADSRSATDRLEDLGNVGYLADSDEAETGTDEFFLGHGERGRARTRLALTPEQRAELVLQHCRRLPNERPRDMFFRFWGDNPFELAAYDHLSTFSVDVDTASYTLARRYVKEGRIPEKAQVRTEEFVNYLDSGVPSPVESTFAIDLELAPSRFGDSPDTWMMRVVVRGKDVAAEERDNVALTFVVDVSGSMKEGGRLELVKHALRLLVSQLGASDSLAIVAYSNEARVVLPMTSAANGATIEEAIHQLQPDGGTNAEAGLRMGYAQAVDGLTPGAQNRVVLLSDGVANIGETDADQLNEDVRVWRERGIYLNTVGVGMNNHNDAFLEQLADKGDGVCNYIDDAAEAKKVLVDQFTGAFQAIARDVKIQVDFDPAQVERYRLLGYENRAIADADFRNDKVDAGEVGAGHQVTALYELVRFGNSDPARPLATVRVRYKAPHGKSAEGAEGEVAHEMERSISASETSGSWSGTTPGYRQAALVAQYAEFLRRSVHARHDSYGAMLQEIDALRAEAPDPAFAEFAALAETTKALLIATAPRHDALSDAVDELRRNRYLVALCDDLQRDEADAIVADLARQNSELEGRIRELLEQRAR